MPHRSPFTTAPRRLRATAVALVAAIAVVVMALISGLTPDMASAQPGPATSQPATIGLPPAGKRIPPGDPGDPGSPGSLESRPPPPTPPRSAPTLGTLPLPVVIAGDGVIVRAEAGLDGLAARTAARTSRVLDEIHADLQGLPVPPSVEIRLVKRARDLAGAAPQGRGAPEWASGVAYSDSGVAVVATRNGSESIDVANVVDHELAHVALGAALRGRAPRWLHEGFAFIHAPELSEDRVQTLTGMVWFDSVIPITELDRAFHGDANQVNRAYSQSYDFVAFLVRRGSYADRHDDGNRWAFRRFLHNIASGLTPSEAARNAYGASLSSLFDEWRGDLRDRYLLMPAGMFSIGVWALAAVLLMIGFVRRRSINRRRLTRWEIEEAGRQAAAEGPPGEPVEPRDATATAATTATPGPVIHRRDDDS